MEAKQLLGRLDNNYGAKMLALFARMGFEIVSEAGAYTKQPGAGTMRRREREATAAKNRAPIVQGPMSRQVQRAAMRRTFKDLRSERKAYAMKAQYWGGSATIREV